MKKEDQEFASRHFGVPEEDIIHYNVGICYGRLIVKTKESAEIASESVKGGHVNGGWFDGMPLGGITENKDGTFGVKV